MKKEEAQKRAKVFAKDLQGIFGRLPVERIVSRHLDLFQELRTAGITWKQIADLMYSVGVTRESGKKIPREQWTSMFSRALKKSHSTESMPVPKPSPKETVDSKATLSKSANQIPETVTQEKKSIRTLMAKALGIRNG